MERDDDRASFSRRTVGLATPDHSAHEGRPTDRKGTVERAFDIAREGECLTLMDIRRRLSVERYEAVERHMAEEGQNLKRLLEVNAA